MNKYKVLLTRKDRVRQHYWKNLSSTPKFIQLRERGDPEKYYHFWHGTPVQNKESIIQSGILPRKQTSPKNMVETILAQQGVKKEHVPKDIYEWPETHVQSTRKNVYLGTHDYARQNSLAGLEAENEIKVGLWEHTHPNATEQERREYSHKVWREEAPKSAMFLAKVSKEKYPGLDEGYDQIIVDKVPPEDIVGYQIEQEPHHKPGQSVGSNLPKYPHSPIAELNWSSKGLQRLFGEK